MNDIDKLVARMTLDEKISLVAGVDLWHTAAIERLGIPAIKMTDGPNGARGAWGDTGPTSALFPVGTALAATWDTALIEQMGAELARETKAKGAQILLGPTVNIHRTPRAGRNFECFSEDPYLAGKMAAAYIRGLQQEGISACIKHFVCNDQEFERMSISAEVDERTLREIYLEPFRRALAEAKPWAIMSSYNRLNGTYASENARLLKELLKQEWGFDGLVISDWKGTYSENVPAGGLDLEMPGPARWMSSEMVKHALESGKLNEAELNDKVARLLKLILWTEAFGRAGAQEERAEDTPAQRAFMRSLARETIVLLKNEQDLLPLDPLRTRKIAVIGELARWPNAMGGGSSRVRAHYVVAPLEGIRHRAGAAVDVQYALGCIVHRHTPGFEPGSVSDESGQKQGLTLRIYDNLDCSGVPAFEMTSDRSSFDWWGPGVPNVNQSRFSASLTGVFTAAESGQHTFALSSIGQSRLLLNDQLAIDNWDTYTFREEKVVQKVLKAGEKVGVDVRYCWNDPSDWRFLRVGHWGPSAADPITEAVALAAAADGVIVVAGLTNEWESEGYDRVDMNLPGRQDELIEKVAQANPKTIVVLNAGSPIAMPWAGHVPAIVEQWYNSQELGNALADILFGDADPSGRLPTTFPRHYEDNPTLATYPGKGGQTFYKEGLLVGYRHYDAKGIEPLFPFGHGLSYTRFEYSDLRASKSQLRDEEELDVSVEVHNAGKRTGKEIIQLYVHDVESSTLRPEQELRGFVKAELRPGETKTIQFQLGRDAFWHYDPAKASWEVEPGEFEIRIGHSSRDLPLRTTVRVLCATAEAASEQAAQKRQTSRIP